jgi:Tfp pilus assembly protein PilZ
VGEGGSAQVAVEFDSEKAFRECYERDLAYGAIFVPSDAAPRPGTRVGLELRLAFCELCVHLEGEVVVVVPAAMARAGATPGVSLQLRECGEALRRRLERETGLELPAVDVEPDGSRRGAMRFPAQASVVIESEGRAFPAETVDASYSGMLALLPGVDLGEGTRVRVHLAHPRTSANLAFDGRVANQTRCDHGVMAVGIQFQYALDRVDEVTRFIDDLRSFHHAKTLAGVAGSLGVTRLEDVLETFSRVSSAGTLAIRCGEEEGRIGYEEDRVLYARTGLVSGAKALGRMFAWPGARFEFQPGIEPIDPESTPLPLQPAVVAAALERDEIARLDLRSLDADDVFDVDEARLAQVDEHLDALQREIAENAAMGFPLGAILDILPAGDAAVYRAIVDLVESGVLRVRG